MEQVVITLHLGDCLEILPELTGIDAVITDPPYGINYIPNWNKWDGSPSDYERIINDDKPFDPSPFMSFPTVVLFGANYYSCRLPLGGWLVWDKRLDEKKDKMIGSPFELAWFRSKKTRAKAKMVRILHGGVVNADSVHGNNEKRYHPTQKPVKLMSRIIAEFTKEGDTILDPYMGSGSTGVAAVQLGRNFVGCEINPQYYAIAAKRINEAKMVEHEKIT